MIFNINGTNYEIEFGLRFIRELDKIYTQKIDGMEFGMGVETAVMYLQLKNPIVIYDLIKAGTAHLKSKPSNSQIESEIARMAGEGELSDLFDMFQEEMENSVFLKPKLKQITEFAEGPTQINENQKEVKA